MFVSAYQVLGAVNWSVLHAGSYKLRKLTPVTNENMWPIFEKVDVPPELASEAKKMKYAAKDGKMSLFMLWMVHTMKVLLWSNKLASLIWNLSQIGNYDI